MVDQALLEQVLQLDAASRLELRDAIEASVADDLTLDLATLLADRVAEDNTADHDKYISFEELERQTRTRRTTRIE